LLATYWDNEAGKPDKKIVTPLFCLAISTFQKCGNKLQGFLLTLFLGILERLMFKFHGSL